MRLTIHLNINQLQYYVWNMNNIFEKQNNVHSKRHEPQTVTLSGLE